MYERISGFVIVYVKLLSIDEESNIILPANFYEMP